MNIGRQWENRLRIWDETLAGELFPCIQAFDEEGFTTMESFTLAQAKTKPFKKVSVGTKWGKKWEYGWVHATVTVPTRFRKNRIWVRIGAGPEMLVFVNDTEAGSIDRQHNFVIVNKIPKNGVLDIYAEVYAGHGPRVEGAGIVRREDAPLPSTPQKQVKIAESTFGYIDEEIAAVYFDYHLLYEQLKLLPDSSVRAGRIFAALKAFTNTTLPEEESKIRRESYLEAHSLLKPLMEEHNGDDAPNLTVFGQSHIDIAWLWTRAETRRKTARTFSNQLTLMDMYDEHRFLLCEPVLFEWLKNDYPELFERVVAKAKEGRFIPEGGMYVESDVNLAGAEPLVRQFVLGRRLFRDYFDTESEMAWMPDTFGYSAALPQIMKKCGIKYFSTQKLMRQDPEFEAFPYNDFEWEGLDGSKVLSHIFKKNNAVLSLPDICNRWENDRLEYGDADGMMYPFGYGDGGGGPTLEMLETLKRLKDLAGVPKCTVESPKDYFKRLEKKGTKNTYYGELYLAWHRGTYTAQSEIKKLVRAAEQELREAEFLQGMARLFGEADKKREEKLNELYKALLVNEFHDILPGSSIEQVNKETRAELRDIIKAAANLAESTLIVIAGENAVFNSLSWERKYKGVTLPSCGFVTLDKSGKAAMLETAADERISVKEVTEDGKRLIKVENGYYTAIVNEKGEITSLKDAKNGYEYAKSPLNRLKLYENINGMYDAWELAKDYEEAPVELKGECSIQARRMGKRVTVTVNRTEEHSSFEQVIVFGSDTPVIDFNTKIDWHERHRILKAEFPTTVFTKEILSETQFGYVKRPTHRSRLYEQGMYEIPQHRYSVLTDGENGFALLNDSKYGLSAKDSTMALTLLRAPVFPDPSADQGEHSFRYGIMLFDGPFNRSGVVNTAYEYNLEPTGELTETDAGVESRLSVFETDRPNIIIEACKPAFDHEDRVVLRLYESMGTACRCRLKLPANIEKLFECSMEEKELNEIGIQENAAELEFGAFEIKTLELSVSDRKISIA